MCTTSRACAELPKAPSKELILCIGSLSSVPWISPRWRSWVLEVGPRWVGMPLLLYQPLQLHDRFFDFQRRLQSHCLCYLSLASPSQTFAAIPMYFCHSQCQMCIQTVANSWATSHRYHEHHRHGCILGCSHIRPIREGTIHSESLIHYSLCLIVWQLFAETSSSLVGLSSAHRLGTSASAIDLRLLAVAHLTYHHLRHLGILQHTDRCVGYRELGDNLELAWRAVLSACKDIMT